MSKKFKRTIALICAVCLAAAVMCTFALAQGGTGANADAAYVNVPIYVDGLLACRGYMVKDTTYVTLESVCNAVDQSADVEWTEPAQTDAAKTDGTVGQQSASVTANVAGITVTYTAGAEYMQANGRYLYLPGGSRQIDGNQLFPVRALAKIFGLEVGWNSEKHAVDLSAENMKVLESGDTFYNADDVELMAHIIFAEAGNQPLTGMIGVGAVIMNRVASDRFPDTIKEVVYAPGQFDPVRNGSINLTPTDMAYAAAHLALEGYNTVGASLFFRNPGSSTGYLSDPTFLIKIQDHCFFA